MKKEKTSSIQSESKIKKITKEDADTIKGYKVIVTDLDTGNTYDEIITDCMIMVARNKENEPEIRQTAITKCPPQVILGVLNSLKTIEKQLALELLKDITTIMTENVEDNEDEDE